MSRYDGLIIPRSYSEYINKTDAATLQQALQLNGVLSNTVQSGDNKAVKSAAVNNAIRDIAYSNYNISRLKAIGANDTEWNIVNHDDSEYTKCKAHDFVIHNNSVGFPKVLSLRDFIKTTVTVANDAVRITKQGNSVTITATRLKSLTADGAYTSLIPEGYRPSNTVYGIGVLYKSEYDNFLMIIDLTTEGNLLVKYQNAIGQRVLVSKTSVENDGYGIFFTLTYII